LPTEPRLDSEPVNNELAVCVDFFAPKEGQQLPKSWVICDGGEETGRVNTSTIKRGLSEISRDVLTCDVIFKRLLKQFKVLLVVKVDVKFQDKDDHCICRASTVGDSR
jgi:hypothetical protein